MISYNSHDLPTDACVPVIASFSSDGRITPLYVRLSGESMKVDSFWVRTQFLNTVEFNCKVIEQQKLKPLVLVYHRDADVWTVPQQVMAHLGNDSC